MHGPYPTTRRTPVRRVVSLLPARAVWCGCECRRPNLARNLAARRISCRFLPMVLAHWYSRAAFGGATVVPPVTPRLGENQLEAFESIGPARRGLPRDRRLRRHPAARRPAPAAAPTEPAVPTTSCRPSSRPRTSRSARASGPTRSRSRPWPSTRATPAPSGRDPGHRPDRAPAGRHRRSRSRPTTLRAAQQGQIIDIECPPTSAAWPSRSTRSRGVGTVIKTGDYVDMVVGFNGDQFPVITANPAGHRSRSSPASNGTSVKLLLQGMQVVGTLLPPPPRPRPPPEEGSPRHRRARPLTGQQEIVILAVDGPAGRGHQVRPAGGRRSDLPGPSLADDFIDPATNQPFPDGPVPDAPPASSSRPSSTSYGVLPPELIETVLPTPAALSPRRPARRRISHRPRRDGRDGPAGPAPVVVRGHDHQRTPTNRQHPRGTKARPPDGRPDPRPHRRRHPGDPRSPDEAARLRERHRRGRLGGVRRGGDQPRDVAHARTSS